MPLVYFKGKEGDVDKGSNRDTPGNTDGARPPKKDDYEDSNTKKNKEPQGEEVDNEEKDRNKKQNSDKKL